MIDLFIRFKINTGKEEQDRQLCDKFKTEFISQWDQKLGSAAQFIRPKIIGEVTE